MIRNIIKLDLPDLGLELGMVGGAWLLTELIQCVGIRLWGGVERVPAIGAAIALYGSALLLFVLDLIRTQVDFSVLLRFPLTRRCQLLGHMAAMLVHGLAVTAFALALGVLGGWLHPLLYAGLGLPIVSSFAYVLWPLAAALVLLPLPASLIVAGVVQRFGRTGGWVLYFACMIPVWNSSWLFEASVPWWTVGPVLAAALLLLLGLSVHWLLHAAVRS